MSLRQDIEAALMAGRETPIRPVSTTTEILALPRDTVAVHVDQLDDSKAEALSLLGDLVWLGQCGNSRITDAGLAHLARLSKLEVLDLEWSTQITDAGLSVLTALRYLKWIDVGFCERVTPEGIAALRTALPELEVEYPGADDHQ